MLCHPVSRKKHAVVVFDAPLATEEPKWPNIGEFYPDARALRPDVPLLRVRRGDTCGRTKLVLVHGVGFSDDMATFATELQAKGGRATVLDEVAYPHLWDSGWLQPAIRAALPHCSRT